MSKESTPVGAADTHEARARTPKMRQSGIRMIAGEKCLRLFIGEQWEIQRARLQSAGLC